MLLDFLIVPKETRELWKLNKIHEDFNSLVSWDYFRELQSKAEKIQLNDDKRDLLLNFMNLYVRTTNRKK